MLSGCCSLKECGHLPVLAYKDEPWLARAIDAFFILGLGLHILYGISGFHLQHDGLASQGLPEDLHFDLLVTKVL